MFKNAKRIIFLLLLCGESVVSPLLLNEVSGVDTLRRITYVNNTLHSEVVTNCHVLRRIKSIDDYWHFNTKIGKVTLTDYRWATHIHIKHPFVTPEAIRKALEHPAVIYKSRKRWCFEKDNLRVVIGNDNKVVTAYYMDGC